MTARARFDNRDDLLVPGMIAKARLQGRGPYSALLVPDEAIQRDRAQRFVYVLAEGDTAVRRVIETGPRAYGLRVVRSGLESSDRILISGLARVRPGAVVSAMSIDLEERAQPDPAQEEFGVGPAEPEGGPSANDSTEARRAGRPKNLQPARPTAARMRGRARSSRSSTSATIVS